LHKILNGFARIFCILLWTVFQQPSLNNISTTTLWKVSHQYSEKFHKKILNSFATTFRTD
jgi:hypothetical protein